MTLSELLKTSTRPLHDTAETHNFQRLLANGLLPIPAYAAYLGQLFLIHQSLEKQISKLADSDQRLCKPVSPEQFQEPHLKADLVFLDVEIAAIKPLPATDLLLGKINLAAEQNPVSLLGFHYVLLGSKHGGKYIAHNLKQKYGFDGLGTKYFDPYGDQFMPTWRGFIDELNKIKVSESDTTDIVEAAKSAFIGISEIGSAMESEGADRK
jgi:heme oxygenase